MKILVIIPAHNEAKAIGAVVADVRKFGHDVLVIDDGSVDETAKIAKQSGASVLSTGQKSGKGKALRLGFDYAKDKPYDALITMDGDGQHHAGDIQKFVDAFASGSSQLINGNRMGSPDGMPWVRLMTNKFMSWIISWVCRQKVEDTQCGFRLISNNMIRSIAFESDAFEIETEILIKASRAGFKIMSVPVQTIYRDEISKIKPFKDTLRFIRYIIRALGQR